MQKGFAQILVVVLFLIGLAFIGAYYLETRGKFNLPLSIASPTPTTNLSRAESNNWKTYINQKYGFALKYPSNWKINETPRDNWSIVTFEGETIVGPPEPVLQGLSIRVESQSGFLNAKQLVDNEIEKMRKLDSNFSLTSRKAVFVGGEQAELTVGFPSKFGSIDTFVIHNHRQFTLAFSPYAPSIKDWKSNELEKTADQILSTFKFLK